MPNRRLFPSNLPPWLVLIAGMMLGSVLTSTFTFRFWWCSYEGLSVDRETLSVIQINEHIHSYSRFLNRDGCLCGSDIERLKDAMGAPGGSLESNHKATPLTSSASLLEKDQTYSTDTVAAIGTKTERIPMRRALVAQDSAGSFDRYLFPTNISFGIPEGTTLSEEFTKKQPLLVAITTKFKNLERAAAIYDTWALDVGQVVFFIAEEGNLTSFPVARGLPIVKLPAVSNSSSVHHTFAILRYLHDNHANSFQWFVLTNDDIYIRGQRLISLLSSMDASQHVFLGRGVTGREDDVAVLRLLPGEHYCMGGPGMVLSSATLLALAPRLDFCLGAMKAYNMQAKVPWSHYDVELGRCVSRTLGVQCSNSVEALSYFIHGYLASPLTPSHLQAYPELITYHSVPDATSMHFIHQFFKTQEFNLAVEKVKSLSTALSDHCTAASLPASFQLTSNCDYSMCPPTNNSPNKCPVSGVVTTPSKSFPSATRFDYQAWEHFDGMQLYNDRTIHPSHSLRACRDRRHELQIILGKAVQVASEQYGRHLRFRKLINGYVRHNPIRGNEYIVDAQFIDFRNPKVAIETRVNLVRPLASNYLPIPDNNNVETTIHFVVPMSNVNERFKQFMKNYESVVLKPRENANLILSVYGDEDIKYVQTIVKPYTETYPKAKIIVIKGQGTFSRSKALNLGMMQLRTEDLAFLCDVDMDIGAPFLNRCRRNTIQGKRVYYPEFFKMYNMDYVYYKRPKPDYYTDKRSHGHWAFYSFGMLCIYKSDYHLVGGLNTNFVGWGDEDVNFFEQVLRRRIEVFRSPDTALRHHWHEKTCLETLTEKQYKHCLSSRGENLADRIELANFIYNSGTALKFSSSQPGNHSHWVDLVDIDEEEEEREAGDGEGLEI